MLLRSGEQRRQPARLARRDEKHCVCLGGMRFNSLFRIDLGAACGEFRGVQRSILLQARDETKNGLNTRSDLMDVQTPG